MTKKVSSNQVFIYFNIYFFVQHLLVIVITKVIESNFEFDKTIISVLSFVTFALFSFFLIRINKLRYAGTILGKCLIFSFGLPVPIALSIMVFKDDLQLAGFVYFILMLPTAIHFNVLKDSLINQTSSRNY